MNDPSIALDMENTIAATQHTFLQKYNDRNNTDYTIFDIDSWDWVREEIHFEDFMQTVDFLWAHEIYRIPPTEEALAESVDALSNIGTVDIVTNRTGCRKGMEFWLKSMDIRSHNALVTTDESKANLDYDFYIDDNPNLYNQLDRKGRLFLIKRPYNPYLWEKDDLTAVGTVRETVIELQGMR